MRQRHTCKASCPTINKTKGFTLVEMLVGMLISLLLMMGLVTLMTNSNRAYRELSTGSEQQENGRYALHILKKEIQHAGFYGEYYLRGDTGAALPNPCSTAMATFSTHLPFHMQGYDNADPGCLTDYKANTDVLVVRRASLGPPGLAPTDTLDPNRYYIQSQGNDYIIDTGTNNNTATYSLTKIDSSPRDVRAYNVHIYFIANNNTAGDGIPTLKRMILTTGGFTEEALVEGIENMQIDYGVATVDTRGTPDSYVTALADPADWMYVSTVQINLLATGTEQSPDPNYQDTKTYNLGLNGNVGPFNDRFKRHTFSSTVRVTNIANQLDTKIPDL